MFSSLIGEFDDFGIGNCLTTPKIPLTNSFASHKSKERPSVNDSTIDIDLGLD
ncbi:hypothetical protein WH5701_00040 [Synechococcus sp. WH 5701]|nr:hypothetical protein WH5701_00040 [Synechococcus sp. WH 5701]